jgi:hypothetical protein
LWLFAKNKLLTRDDLGKRKNLDDNSCSFYSENESLDHIFFDCCVSCELWINVNEVTGVNVGHDFDSVAKLWLSDKKFNLVNVCTTVVLWSLWKSRNDMIFQGTCWLGMKRVLRRCAGTLRNWKWLLNPKEAGELERWALELERRVDSPPSIAWELHVGDLNNIEHSSVNSLNACNRIGDTFVWTVVVPVRELDMWPHRRWCWSGVLWVLMYVRFLRNETRGTTLLLKKTAKLRIIKEWWDAPNSSTWLTSSIAMASEFAQPRTWWS